MRSLRWHASSTNFLWWCLHWSLYTVAVVSVEYIYAPADALKVNGKTVLTYFNQKVTWNEAASICKSKYSQKGGTLAKIDSAAVARFLFKLLSVSGQDVWFGLYYKQQDKLSWSDQSCTDFNTYGFSQFNKDEDTYEADKRCYYLESNSGLWRRDKCQSSRNFVCEYLDFSSSTCATGDIPPFDEITATFYSVSKNRTDAQMCTSDCSSIQGCFLTWTGNNMCLLGVIDTSGRTYVKNRCIETTTEPHTVSYTHNKEENPRVCVKNNMNIISGIQATPISSNASSGWNCPENRVTETVVRTSIASVTTTSVQIQTTTITSRQIVKTTDIRTMTTVSIHTTTITSAAQMTATTIYETAACSDIPTVIVPTTVTEISVSTQSPTISTYTSYVNCRGIQSEVTSLCPSKTVTEETTNYVTTTLTDCPTTPCYTTTCTTSESRGINPGGIYIQGTVTKTITEFDCTVATPSLHAINAMETTNFDRPLVRTTSKINIFPTVTTAITHCTATTTIASLLTTTKTWTATPTCDIVTSQIHRTNVMSSAYVTLTVTQFVETNNSKIYMENPCHKIINDTILEQEIDEITISLVEDLTVPTSNLSSTRRRKGSMEDNRLSAKIPGIFACALLLCSFGLLILLDLRELTRDLLHKVKKHYKQENTRL